MLLLVFSDHALSMNGLGGSHSLGVLLYNWLFTNTSYRILMSVFPFLSKVCKHIYHSVSGRRLKSHICN